MQQIFKKIARNIRGIYHKAEDLIEEERELPLSQNLLNATIQKYVTDNVEALKDLHADIYDDWCRLYATLDYKGIHTTLSVDLRLVQMQLDKDIQQLVFEQISETQVISASFSSPFKKLAFNVAVYFFQRILHKDPLGLILEKLDVIEIKHDLLYLGLNKYLEKSDKVINTLKKIHVNHAILREGQFVLKANLNLQGIFRRDPQKNTLILDIEDFEDVDSAIDVQPGDLH
ncbi:hypothetical protein ACF3NA_08000 [Alkanindiges sp. WGS2144]|uniref:hypothetical protein n=1 Tax=Alkanindiges sp. WGS2144 TaxID=3366808 RepID=UPI003752C0C1